MAVGLGVIPQFPASVLASSPLKLDVANGIFTLSWDARGGFPINLDNSSPQQAMPSASAYTGKMPLQVAGADNQDTFVLYDTFGLTPGGHNSTPHVLFRSARGTRAAPTAIGAVTDLTPTYVSLGDYFGAILATGHDGSAYDAFGRAAMAFRPTQTWAAGAHGAGIAFATTPNATLNTAWRHWLLGDGRFLVNLNTVAPEAPLIAGQTTIHTVAADGSANVINTDTYGGTSVWVARYSSGSSSAKIATGAGITLLTAGSQTWDGSSWNTNASITFNSLNSQSGTDHSGYIGFNTVQSGTTTYSEKARLTDAGALNIAKTAAVPAGGTTGLGLTLSSTANLGLFFGSGAPTLSAAQGSLYIRTDGSSTSTRAYVNTNGTTGWAAITTAS